MNPMTPELLCTDLRRSTAFYVDMLGFQVVFERPEHGFAYMERDGVHWMLEQLGADREWITGAMEYPFGRGINFQIRVDDVQTMYAKFQQAGWPIYLELEDKWYRQKETMKGNRQFIVQDPDGYLLRLAQDLGAKPVEDAS